MHSEAIYRVSEKFPEACSRHKVDVREGCHLVVGPGADGVRTAGDHSAAVGQSQVKRVTPMSRDGSNSERTGSTYIPTILANKQMDSVSSE